MFLDTIIFYKKKLLAARLLPIIVWCICLSACKKETHNELEKLASDMSGIQNSYIENGYSINLYKESYNFTPDFKGIPATLSKTASSNDTVFAQVDPSLVAQYNQLFGENNKAIPDSAFGVSHNGMFPILNGSQQSLDSVYAILKNSAQLIDSNLYLVPIRLTEKNNSGLKTSILFFKMLVRKYDSLSAMIDVAGNYGAGGASTYAIARKDGYYLGYFPSKDGNGVVTSITTLKVGIRINTRFYAHDLKVSARVMSTDSSAKAYGSTYNAFPENAFTVLNSEVTIPAGSLYGKDSIVLQMNTNTIYKSYVDYMLLIDVHEHGDKNYKVPMTYNKSKVYLDWFVF